MDFPNISKIRIFTFWWWKVVLGVKINFETLFPRSHFKLSLIFSEAIKLKFWKFKKLESWLDFCWSHKSNSQTLRSRGLRFWKLTYKDCDRARQALRQPQPFIAVFGLPSKSVLVFENSFWVSKRQETNQIYEFLETYGIMIFFSGKCAPNFVH